MQLKSKIVPHLLRVLRHGDVHLWWFLRARLRTSHALSMHRGCNVNDTEFFGQLMPDYCPWVIRPFYRFFLTPWKPLCITLEAGILHCALPTVGTLEHKIRGAIIPDRVRTDGCAKLVVGCWFRAPHRFDAKIRRYLAPDTSRGFVDLYVVDLAAPTALWRLPPRHPSSTVILTVQKKKSVVAYSPESLGNEARSNPHAVRDDPTISMKIQNPKTTHKF